MAMDGTIAKLRVEGKTALVPLLRPIGVSYRESTVLARLDRVRIPTRGVDGVVLRTAARLYSDVEYLPPTTRLPIMLVNAPHKAV